MPEKRKDSKGRVLKDGESQRANGTYDYRYTDIHKKRRCIYAKSLTELRKKEEELWRDLADGIGVLVKRRGLALEPLIHGGESTTIYRSGTPTVALACSLALALDKAVTALPQRAEYIRGLNARLRAELAKYPKVRINSPEHAVPQILNLSVQNVKGTVFQRELDARGVCVSVKSACSSDGLPSRAVFAVSRDRRNALSSWRISLSHLTTDAEIDEFLSVFDACYHELVK